MEDKKEKPVHLNFLKHDWFQKADGRVTVHLYVKSITDCHVQFKEEHTIVSFSTNDANFLKIHGPKCEESEEIKNISFIYSISTRENIVPDQSSYKVENAFIELNLMKAVSQRWTSLEALKHSSNGNKTSTQSSSVDTKKTPCSDFSCSSTKTINEKQIDSSPKHIVSETTKGRCSNNMQLLGGKSTLVLKKIGEQESRPEKETGSSSDQQQTTSSTDTESQKNVNKTVSFKTETLGLTGLENYANNCYMNVVIQVLANIPEIRDYFIGEHFLNSLSTNNPMSSGGRVAKAFYEVINALWSDNKAVVRPQVLKNIMGKRCSLFMGSQQCDAQEFFATLLDNLHEDLKLIPRCDKSNENVSNKEDETTSNNDKADVAWDHHVKRNNSMIVKLFHGQMVSKLTCQSCHKKSVTYEPCAQVSLPIPMNKQRMTILVFFKDISKRPVMTSLQISSAHAQLWHVLNMLEKRINIPAHCLRTIQVSRGSLIHIFDENSPLSSVNTSKILVACEVKDEKETDSLSLPFIQHRVYSMRHINCGNCKKSQNDLEMRLKRCTRCMHIAYCSKECQSKHWPFHQKDCRKGYKESIGLPFFVAMRKSKFTYEALTSTVLNYANFSVSFNRINEKDSDSSESDQEDKNRLQKQEITNTLLKAGENSRRISSSSDFEQDDKKRLPKIDESCNTAAKVSEDDCRASYESDKAERNRAVKAEGASNVVQKSNETFLIKAFYKEDREPISITADDFKIDVLLSANYLSIEWQSNIIREKEIKELHANVNIVGDHAIYDAHHNNYDDGGGDKCSIEDCLSMFMEPDRINEADGWKCPKCKTVQAVKKEMALTYPPPIMLVHFKRFTFASYGQKITKPIYYPRSGLDLSNYLAHETRDNLSVPPVYDLTGVICHRGSMGIGHYTCLVQTLGNLGQTDIGWRYFDDDQVAKLSEENVVCSSAYVLVYRMREIANALKMESPFMNVYAIGNDMKQDKTMAPTKSFNRQLSAEGNLKEKSTSISKVESGIGSPRFSLKRSNSSEPILHSRRSSGLRIDIEAGKHRETNSGTRSSEHFAWGNENIEQYEDVFDDDDDDIEKSKTLFASEKRLSHMNSEFNQSNLKNSASIISEPLHDDSDVIKIQQPRTDAVTPMETEACEIMQPHTDEATMETEVGEVGFESFSIGDESRFSEDLNNVSLNSELMEFESLYDAISKDDHVKSNAEMRQVVLNVDDITENELD